MRFRLLSILLLSILLLSGIAGCKTGMPSEFPRHTLAITFTLDEYDAEGSLKSHKTLPSRSYVLAMADLVYTNMKPGNQSIPDTSNTSRTQGPSGAGNMQVAASATNAAYGIVVGTGTNGVAIADYALQTLIAHGVGAGQLSYGAVTVTAPATNGSTRQFTVIRTLTNGSGGTITIQELGVYAYGGTYYYCIIRDRYVGGYALTNGHALTITYTISVTA